MLRGIYWVTESWEWDIPKTWRTTRYTVKKRQECVFYALAFNWYGRKEKAFLQRTTCKERQHLSHQAILWSTVFWLGVSPSGEIASSASVRTRCKRSWCKKGWGWQRIEVKSICRCTLIDKLSEERTVWIASKPFHHPHLAVRLHLHLHGEIVLVTRYLTRELPTVKRTSSSSDGGEYSW